MAWGWSEGLGSYEYLPYTTVLLLLFAGSKASILDFNRSENSCVLGFQVFLNNTCQELDL